jgi:enamine deaminase RidA (YjgF/YER057c/UK114 family)
MTIQLFNPPGIPTPEAYAQVSVATGSRTVHIAGQVARTAEGEPVGAGDLAVQVEQVYRNLATALRAVGADFEHVAKLTVYVVDWHPDKMGELITGAVRAAEDLALDIVRPITLIGVAALGEPDMLVEVEAVAVID